MSELKFSLEEEESPSPDLFSDAEFGTNVSIAGTSDETSSTSAGQCEPDLNTDDTEWKGISLDEIHKHLGPFNWHHLPPIQPSPSHTILFELPLPNRGPPRAHPVQSADKWSQNFVRMPYSAHSLYPIDLENETSGGLRRRWEVIQEALLQNFVSSHQIEAAILSYNHKYAERWDFAALHHFFDDYIDEEETKICMSSLIPKMIQLALQLPDLITSPIPLLKRQTNRTISLSQLQVASLLANAFFCTFPRRNSTNPQSEYGSFPFINFNRLFSSFKEERMARSQSVMEKLKCIFHYFRRVTSKTPEGTITIQRRYIPKKNCPRWDKQQIKLTPLHITSIGNIESQGAGFLQVDFANKFVGGGVLNYGCVQEEIRFVICPELLITMLVSESLEDTEALIVNGVERYSRYEGYSNNFKWVGDFVDETPRDSSGRLKTCIVAIDALQFKQPKFQFNLGNVIRELNKAYVGFSSDEPSNNLPAIATGNWGCGAFRGNPHLKVLIQLMAAAVAGRSMVYFTFGDTSLRDSVADMYWHLIKHDVDVGRLFTLISQYQEVLPEDRSDFYRFLYNRSKIKPLTYYFKSDHSGSPSKSGSFEDKKSPEEKSRFNFDFKQHASKAKLKEDGLKDKIGKWLEEVENEAEPIIEDSSEKQGTSSEEMAMQAETSTSKAVEECKIDIEIDDMIIPSTKTKQTFGELFGDKKFNVLPQKKISDLDTFDKLLLFETTNENTLKKDEIDMSMDTEKNEKKTVMMSENVEKSLKNRNNEITNENV